MNQKSCDVNLHNSWNLLENLSIHEKKKVYVQIYVEDKLLDQNEWKIDTKNVNVYSLRLD